MNRTFIKYVVIASILFIPSLLSAQDVIKLSGTQTRGNMGRNAQIHSSPVVLRKNRTVVSVSGYNRGFWINSKKYGKIASYYKSNDRDVIGLVLERGTYYIYPNLGQRQSSGSVTIKLK